jgi:GNAT superfamily N-acetyltransferase
LRGLRATLAQLVLRNETSVAVVKALFVNSSGWKMLALDWLERFWDSHPSERGAGGMTGRDPSVSDLTIRPLTPDLWPSLEDLFGHAGGCGGCWCMYWRIGAAYRRRPREDNRTAFKAVVEQGPPPGLLALSGETPVGWCQITPRDALPGLERPWRLKRVDEAPVWSLSCFYVRIGWRRRGVTRLLLAEAAHFARGRGAEVLEAYPFDAAVSPSASSTGYLSSFERAGFKVVARRAPARPIVRLDLV